jgi:peptidoglycan/LPS O-acetylase OafA/YrhL
MNFRKDLNGLRAIAVIAVVLFHFNASWLPGGFSGVDVFFVISGFLMTGIVIKGIEIGGFSILKFYIARANRIIPALAVLCLVLLVFGWFCLTPLDYKSLGKHVAGSIGFLSNVIYWSESGYFEAASHDKWLLHTWSLSAEWQFYIAYPLVLVAMSKFMLIKTMRVAILLGAVFGFIFCIISTYRWPNASYFLLSTRAWEMLIGGVAYLFPFALQEKRKKIVEGLGLTLIVGSYFFITKESPWPGYLAILPVLGSFLVIQSQCSNSLITSNFVFQKIGSWSYSIYLWHWPLVVAIYYFSLNEYYIYVGIFLSLLLGFLSNEYIEKIKFRNNFYGFFDYLKCKPVYFALIVGLLGSVVYISQGASARFHLAPKIKTIMNELVIPHRNNGYCFYSFNNGLKFVDKEMGTDCYLGSKHVKSSTLLFGDSYAGHSEPFFDEVFKANDASFQSIVTNWCFPTLSDEFTGPKTHLAYQQCLLNRQFLKNNAHNYKNIILAASWDNVLKEGYIEGVELLINKLAMLDVNVFIMAGPYRYKKNPLQNFYRSIYFDYSLDIDAIGGYDKLMTIVNIRLQSLSEKYEVVHFINRSLLYKESNTFEQSGVTIPYSLDGGHISILGSKKSANYFMEQDEYGSIMKYFDLH